MAWRLLCLEGMVVVVQVVMVMVVMVILSVPDEYARCGWNTVQ